jgi:hypothetical protein
MIDSRQKNLMPEGGSGASDEFGDPAFPRRVWEHIVAWCKTMDHAAQVIAVDNRPPDLVDLHVVVRYSGHAGEPPYGLIEGETG